LARNRQPIARVWLGHKRTVPDRVLPQRNASTGRALRAPHRYTDKGTQWIYPIRLTGLSDKSRVLCCNIVGTEAPWQESKRAHTMEEDNTARIEPVGLDETERGHSIWERLMPELVRLIIEHTNDRDFWSIRQSHRMFRLEYTTAEMERRAAHKWVRVSPERACKCKRADVLSLLYERRRVPRGFDPWSILAVAGDDATFAVVAAHCNPHSPNGRSTCAGCPLAVAVDHGHCNIVLSMCALFDGLSHHALYYALYKGRSDIALKVHKALNMEPCDLVTAAAKAGCVEIVEAMIHDNASIPWMAIAEIAAAGGSLGVVRHVAAAHCAAIAWQKPLIRAVKNGHLETVRFIVSLEALTEPLDLGAALTEAVTFGHDTVVDFLLDIVDLKSLECKPAINAAMVKKFGFRSLYAMYERGMAVDLQAAFDRYATFGHAFAVTSMCAKSPWLNRQRALEKTIFKEVARALIAAGRDGIDFDAAIAARGCPFYEANDSVTVYLKQERDRSSTVSSLPSPFALSES